MTKKWDNKIVRHGVEHPDQLLANERNHRIHPKPQQDYMLAALNDVGWVQDVIVNLRTSDQWPAGQRNVQTLVDGHLRVKLALRHDIQEIPVKYVDLTPNQEALVLATLDAITEKAEIDPAMLNMLLQDVNTGEPALQELLAQMAEEAGMIPIPEGNKNIDEKELAETNTECPKCGFKWMK